MIWPALFIAGPGDPDIPHRFIIDDVGYWPIDEEYADKGIEGGWLKYTGCYWLNGQLIFHYSEV